MVKLSKAFVFSSSISMSIYTASIDFEKFHILLKHMSCMLLLEFIVDGNGCLLYNGLHSYSLFHV